MDPTQIEALHIRMGQIALRAEQIQAAADQEGRELTRTESVEIDTLVEEFDVVERQIKTREGAARITVGGRKTEPNPIDGPALSAPRRSSFISHLVPPSERRVLGARMAELFGSPPNTGKIPFRSAEEYFRTAMVDPADPRFRQIRNAGLNENIGEDGAYHVPNVYSDVLLDDSLALEALRPRCSVIPMTSNQVFAPQFDYHDNTNGQRAGLALQWADEGGVFVDQKTKTLPLTIRANKCGIFIRATSEVLEDAPSFDVRLHTAMVRAIAAGLDYAILWGNGAGTWLGVLQSPCLKVVAKETAPAQSADTLLEINITKMAAALHPSCWPNAIWVCSPSTLAQLFQMAQATGPYQGVRTAMITQTDQGLRILGKEVVITDAAAILGDLGDLVLGDFSRYLIGLRREVRLETSLHKYWQSDELSIRMIMRAGGQPEWGKPIKLRTGDTVSCFVALEAR